jgi:type IV secretory pathway TraG/TraD family ATPase VirD4
MGHPSGNEYVHRGHPLARATAWLGAFVGFLLVAWLNLWSITVALWKVHGLATLLWVFQFGKFGYVLIHLVNRDILHPISLDLSRPAPVSQRHLEWLAWKQFAFQHMLGSGIHWGRTAPLAWVLAANLGLFLACWGPAVWRAHQLYRVPDPARRPGTSGWTSRQKLGLYVDAARRPGALPLGTITRGLPGERTALALPAKHRTEHVEVLGVTGSGKTGCVFKPWVLHDGLLNGTQRADGTWDYTGAYSTVAIDIKHPDLYDAVAPYLGAQPHRPLLVLAPDADPFTTMRYNPLDALDRGDPEAYLAEIEALVAVIVENTVGAFQDVQYHREIETRLLQHLVQFAHEADGVMDRDRATEILRPHMEAGQRLPRTGSLPFLALLCKLPKDAFFELISKTVTDPEIPDKWIARFEQQKGRTGPEFTGTLQGLQRRLAAFMSPSVSRVTQHSDFRLETVGERPATLIIGAPMPMSSGEATQTFSAIMITQLVQHLLRLAKQQPTRRLPVPVMIYLDEVINQARIPGLESYVASLRDFGIGFVVGLQDHAGLKKRYGDNPARELLANLRTKIIFGQDLNPDQARESVLPMLGETTIVTHSASSSARGSGESEHVGRRPLMTIDQIRAMPFGEVILGLHGGALTRTRLALMPRRHPETDRWYFEPIPGADTKTLCAPLVRILDTLPMDRRLTRRFRQERTIQGKPAVDGMVLLSKLDKLGAMFVRKPAHAPAGPAAAYSGGSVVTRDGSAGAPHPNTGRVAVETGDAALTALVETAKRRSHELRETATQVIEKPKAEPAAEPEKAADTATPAHTKAHEEAPAANPAATARQPAADPAHVMDEIRGLYNALLVRRDLPGQDVPRPHVWRVQGDDRFSLAVRREVIEAYAARRSTRVDRMMATWESAGLAKTVPTQIQSGRESVRVYLLTHDAVRDDRVAPNLRDKMVAWPTLGVQVDRSGGFTGNGARRTQVRTEPTRPPVQKTSDPDAVLRAVVRWAEEHRSELVSPGTNPVGQWEAVIDDVPVLLVRSNTIMQLLATHAEDPRAIQQAWKASGVLVISGAPSDQNTNRFTVLAGTGEARLRYAAFRWTALAQAGLQRNGLSPTR